MTNVKAIAVVLLLLAGAASVRADEVGEAVKAARAAIREGDVDAGLARLEQAYETAPTDPRVVQNYAWALIVHRDDLTRAFEILYEHLERSPEDEYSRGLMRKIAAEAMEADPALARNAWFLLRRLDPSAREPLFQWALASYRLGDRAAARSALRELIDRFPSYADPYSLLAKVWLDEGRPERAADTYRDLIVQRPGDATARLKLANTLLWELRDYDAAVEEFAAATDLAPPGSEIAAEAAAQLANAKEQKALAERLRARNRTLGHWLLAILGVYFGIAFALTALTRPAPPAEA